MDQTLIARRRCEMSEVLNVKVDRINKLENGGKLKAFCDLSFGDLFLVRGFRVVEGEKGTFLGLPQQIGKNGKWYNVFTPATKEIAEYLKDVVLQAYQQETEE